MKQILRYLRKLLIYWVIALPIDSVDLGEPVSRPRCYFLLVRQGVGVLDQADEIKSLVAAMAHAAHEPVTCHAASRLFLSDSPCVQAYLQKIKSKASEGGKVGQSGSSRRMPAWPQQHEDFRVAKRLRAGTASVSLPTKRMRSAYYLLKQQAGKDIIGDFSQSINRVHARTDGVCPTVTPNGMIFVGGRGVDRVVTPREKLALNLFPPHKMQIPRGFPEEALGKMGGNTMHLKSVGLALAIGMALVDFSRPPASGVQADKAMPAIELPLTVVRQGL